MVPSADSVKVSVKQAVSLDGSMSGAFAQAARVKLELALVNERRKQDRSKEFQDIVRRELDALTVMLLAEAILLPIALLALGDLLLVILYAGALSLAAFVILLLSLSGLERNDARRSVCIHEVEEELVNLRKIGKAGKK